MQPSTKTTSTFSNLKAPNSEEGQSTKSNIPGESPGKVDGSFKSYEPGTATNEVTEFPHSSDAVAPAKFDTHKENA